MKTKLFELQCFTGRCSLQSGVARLQPRGVVHKSWTDLDGRPLFPGTDHTEIRNPTRFLSWWPFSNTFSLQNHRERPARSTFLHTDDHKKTCERSIWAPKPWMCTKTHHFPHLPLGLLAVVDMSIKLFFFKIQTHFNDIGDDAAPSWIWSPLRIDWSERPFCALCQREAPPSDGESIFGLFQTFKPSMWLQNSRFVRRRSLWCVSSLRLLVCLSCDWALGSVTEMVNQIMRAVTPLRNIGGNPGK